MIYQAEKKHLIESKLKLKFGKQTLYSNSNSPKLRHCEELKSRKYRISTKIAANRKDFFRGKKKPKEKEEKENASEYMCCAVHNSASCRKNRVIDENLTSIFICSTLTIMLFQKDKVDSVTMASHLYGITDKRK